MKTIYLLLLGALLWPAAGYAQQPAQETKAQRDERMQWWRDAKFGMFIHWGVYSVPAGTYEGEQISGIGEWIMRNAKIPVATYRSYARSFNPVEYDPEAWADLAEEAGMRYIVITSKHHDGFALFPSDVTDWDVADATPYGKDLIGPLAEAARDNGLKFGLYYSQAQDWTHPGGAKANMKEGEGWDEIHKGSFDAYLKEIAAPQTREILTRYKPDVLWWDTPTWMNQERADLLRPLLGLCPDIITNNRLGYYPGDTETPEQFVPATGYPGRDWEVCMTMNDTWGFKSYDTNWKSTEDLLHKLVDIVSKGGNFLLNVGPTPEGAIPQASIDRLKAIGRWMDVNGEAIYGTSASPFPYLSWGRATRKGQTLYLHVFDWPSDGRLHVPLSNKVQTAYLLTDPGKKIPVSQEGNRTTLDVPRTAPDPIVSVVALQFEGEPAVLLPPALNKPARASASPVADNAPAKAFDGDPNTFWTAGENDTSGWLEVDLGKPTPIGHVSIAVPWRPWVDRSLNFELQVKEGGAWKTATSGNVDGQGFSKTFPPVIGQVFRLHIPEAKGAPAVSELILFSPE